LRLARTIADPADYNAVASNFKPLGYGAVVPESSTALLALFALLLVSASGRLSKSC
jgi:hypothetical protein